MNKNFNILCLALMLFWGTRSIGQENPSTIGFHFGPNLNSIWENESVLKNMNVGLAAGVDLDIRLSNKLALCTGLEYEQKRLKYKIDHTTITPSPPSEMTIVLGYHYLTLPLLLSYKTTGKNIFHFELGSYISYLLQDRFKLYSDGELTMDWKNHPDQKKIDSGIALGVGVLFPIGEKSGFDIGLRNRFGLVNKINSIGLNLGFKFNL